jgi:hypothetical protein
MTTPHRATPEQWAETEKWAQGDELDSSCILELRSRIESLEAAQQDKLDRLIALDAADPTPDPAMTELRAASAEAQPAGGLVERVATIITLAKTSRGAAEDVLSEVAQAARLSDLNGQSVAVMTWEMVARWLEQEASQ